MVRIVTDSTSDLPPELAKELGITVVPAYVHFGSQSYRDGVDITPTEIYQRMIDGSVHPTTSSPAPGDFAEAYKKLLQETNEIICLTVTSKHSAIYESAVMGKQSIEGKCRIEVIDSQSATMGLGLIAILAAKEAQSGKTMDEVIAAIYSAIPRTHGMCMLDTIKYALKGGRLGKGGGLLGSLVKVKPLLEIKNGLIRPCGLARTRSIGIERLCDFVKKHLHIEDIAVVHSGVAKEAERLADQIRSIVPDSRPIIANLGSALSVHSGPQALVVALRQGKSKEEKVTEKVPRKFTLPTLRIPHRH